MPKALCFFGTAVSVLLIVVFGVDLVLGFPFSGASMMMDISLVVCGAILGYLSWATLREQL